MHFDQNDLGLFIHEISNELVILNYKDKSVSYSFTQTVSKNMAKYTLSEVNYAKAARGLCKRIGSLSPRKFQNG